MVRLFFLTILFLFSFTCVKAQYVRVEVGVDGFTCSMCGMSVENALRRLPFVEDVQMDLNHNIAVVFFRSEKEVSIHKIADQVYSSGFSVRSIKAAYNFPALDVKDHSIFSSKAEEFHFVGIGKDIQIKGLVSIIFLNKKLISRKEYTRWEEWIRKDMKENGKKDNVLYVTLVQD